jgi:ribonuclease HI
MSFKMAYFNKGGNMIQVFCDGGCRNNQSKENIGGWGVVLNLNLGEKVKEIKGSERNTTNNIMEITSCIKALEAIKCKDIMTEVIMDSQYVITGINEWVDGWIKKGWRKSDKKPVENKELWQRLVQLKNEFRNISFKKCVGHSDNEGNNRADALANEAMDELLLSE